jgi:GNAT superfamily N-acetyltransferase
MLFEIPAEDYKKFIHWFDNETFPRTWIETALANKSFHKMIVDDEADPHMVLLHYPYKAFLAGGPSPSKWAEMLDVIPEETEICLHEGQWLAKLIEHFGDLLIRKTRVKTSSRSLHLDHLESLKKPLPDGYSVARVDWETAERLPELLSVHIPPFFGSIERFMEEGIGFCVKDGEAPVCFAGSCIPYGRKLEIQVATVDAPEYRRKGFATAASIALLEYCLAHEIEPCWDAVNDRSVALAEKLGYTDPQQYFVYKWRKSGEIIN